MAVEPCMEWISIKEKTKIKQHLVFITEGFLEVAIKSWPEWDLNSRPPNSVRCSNRLSYQAMTSTSTQSQLCTATSISSLCSVFTFHTHTHRYILLSSTLLMFLIEKMWRLCSFCITSVRNANGLLLVNLLEIISPLIPFENLVTFI